MVFNNMWELQQFKICGFWCALRVAARCAEGLITLVPAAKVPTFYVQGRFDGAFRKGCNRSAIGGCLELVTELSGKGRALLLLAREISCQGSDEAETFAAEALTHECVQLFAKIFLACSA